MATETITLYDTERDILMEVTVSAADAQRAAIDTVFATDLLNRAIGVEEPQPSTSAGLAAENNTAANYSCGNFVEEQTHHLGDNVSFYRWSAPCVLLLLESYRTMENDFVKGKLSHKKIWTNIANILKTSGHDVTGSQCSTKLRSLKKTYKAIKDHNNQSGNDRRNWQFFDIMEDIFAKKAWCDPVAVASSTGLNVIQEDNNSEGECSRRSNKTSTIASLIRKRIQQKEDHEQNKKKRYKESMEMNKKLLEVLEKIANK